MEKRYRVVYTCRLQPGFSLSRVVENLKPLPEFKGKNAYNLAVSRRPRIIKETTSREEAVRCGEKLVQAGLRIKLRATKAEQNPRIDTPLPETAKTPVQNTVKGKTEKRCRVVYTCRLQPGFSLFQVVDNLKSVQGFNGKTAYDLVCSQRSTTIKEDLSYEEAVKCAEPLIRAGLQVEIRSIKAKQPPRTNTALPETGKAAVQNGLMDKMGKTGLMGWFALSHFSMVVIMSMGAAYIGFELFAELLLPLTLLATNIACSKFGRKNKRYFSNNEKIKVTAWFSLFNIFTLILVIPPMMTELTIDYNQDIFYFALGVMVLAQTFFIFWAIGRTGMVFISRGAIT